MISFICVGCGTNLEIGDKWAGKLGHCPHCGTDSPVPGNPRRTSKLTILIRFVALPLAVVAFWACFLGWAFFIGGAITVAFFVFFPWVVTNLGTFLFYPRYYRLWKAGGGDPWFDTLDSPLNTDPPYVRYQELYREKLRQESQQFEPASPDATNGINDPEVI